MKIHTYSQVAIPAVLTLILVGRAPIFGQGAAVTNGAELSRQVEHAVQHIQQMAVLTREAAPDVKSKQLLDERISAAVGKEMMSVTSDPRASLQTKTFARHLARATTTEELARIVSTTPTLRPSSDFERSLIADTFVTDVSHHVMQVLSNDLPAYAIPPIQRDAPPRLSPITNCRSQDNIYPVLSGVIANHSVEIKKLAESVGRIEIKEASGSIYTLIGTAFIVNAAAGLAMTACHVANEIADPNPHGGWVVPSARLGTSSTVLMDFGETDAHEAPREFRVIGVTFLSSVEGCDGALLRIDTSLKPLPTGLNIAANETNVGATAVNVISIGFPTRDLIPPSTSSVGNVTQATYDYFTCIRSSSAQTAKFVFGGEVIANEDKGTYHVLAHIVPTVGGQSGSPIIDMTKPDDPVVIGVHVCCVEQADVQTGDRCEWRNEQFLQEAISAPDIMKLSHTQ